MMASNASTRVASRRVRALTLAAAWHAVFWVNVPIALLAAALTLAGVPESADTSGNRIDVPGAVLVTAGLILAVAGFSRAVSHPWTDSWTLALLIAGAALLAAAQRRRPKSSARRLAPGTPS